VGEKRERKKKVNIFFSCLNEHKKKSFFRTKRSAIERTTDAITAGHIHHPKLPRRRRRDRCAYLN
jgi:hypothetical protein